MHPEQSLATQAGGSEGRDAMEGRRECSSSSGSSRRWRRRSPEPPRERSEHVATRQREGNRGAGKGGDVSGKGSKGRQKGQDASDVALQPPRGRTDVAEVEQSTTLQLVAFVDVLAFFKPTAVRGVPPVLHDICCKANHATIL